MPYFALRPETGWCYEGHPPLLLGSLAVILDSKGWLAIRSSNPSQGAERRMVARKGIEPPTQGFSVPFRQF